MSSELMKKLVESGVHFGHRSSRWNPKMRPYIYARKNLIHIIDVRETIRGLLRAKKYLSSVAQRGSLVLFVGTKRQAGDTIQKAAERCGMPYINDRWLGGTLTNFRTIRSRLGRLEELERIRDTDEINTYSKKMQSSLGREYRKMFRNLNGMRTMNRLPECLFVVDPRKEKNAVKEARKLGIATVALIDTDCDPDEVDLPIPGNDDSMRSIDLIVNILADAVALGKAEAAISQQHKAEGAEPPQAAPPRDRVGTAAGRCRVIARRLTPPESPSPACRGFCTPDKHRSVPLWPRSPPRWLSSFGTRPSCR